MQWSGSDIPLGRVLIIAGSDSGGGAGIQGDIKTITALKGYAATAITALTAQNTQGVFGIHEVPPEFIAQQITLVMEDIGADAFKTGMLHNSAVIETVATCLTPYAEQIPLVLDPVMVAKGGAPLLQAGAVTTLKEKLLPLAFLVTPNIPEAELLCGMTIDSPGAMRRAAHQLHKHYGAAVLLKGGHLPGEKLYDVLVGEEIEEILTDSFIDSPHTHGTGCTLASAIAAWLAQGFPLFKAVQLARAFVREAILTAPGFGKGHGPLNHSHTVHFQ